MATKDFTKQREAISFTIDPDTFRAYPAMAAQTLIDFAAKAKALDSADGAAMIGVYREVLAEVLEPDSFERFTARMADRLNPIDPSQVSDIVAWLFEQYGMRPTQPSEPSPTGPSSPEPGTSSTAVTPVEVSISEPSLLTASSI